MVKDMSDDEIWNMKRGGHDYAKVYAAYHAATVRNGRPTVVLAQTVKGYGLGHNFEARNATHQMKKLKQDDLKTFRDLMHIPVTDEQIESDAYDVPYYHPGADSEEIQYMLERRRKLGGWVPERRNSPKQVTLPDTKLYAVAKKGSGKQMAATTMAFVRLLRDLMRDKGFGERVVPIIPDEARTFGMDSFFPSAMIYNPKGQNYTAVDRELFLAYKESTHGQLLHTGINEAGSMAAFTAAGTSYATHGEPMIPVYVFYSMFGFQRTGDAMWAAMDQMTRGFIIGATAGRTTLTGEGLQHADGHSPLLASTNPAMKIYDPAYGYEIAHILEAGLEQMYGADSTDRNWMYYLTVYNEPISQPAEPEGVDVEGILKGIHRISTGGDSGPKVQLLGSGVSLPVGPGGRDDPGLGVGGQRRRLVGHLVGGAASRRPGRREAQLPAPRRAAPGAVRDPSVRRRPGAGDRLDRLHVRGAGPDPAVPAEPVRHPRGRRPRVLRHPGGGAALLPHRRPVDRGARPAGARRHRRRALQRTQGGGGEVPAARCPRRHHRQRGRRVVTVRQ